ncbi:MAG TPA: hypothetical protein PKC39_01660 [Ferruginibacter sp.]|nr:hypothetical protein [Ferruginibacter sp.]HMP19641.1 hypothetical protein [Ferruginibacter sp.]
MDTIKIVHIHTDPKFIVTSLKNFEAGFIENKLIIIGDGAGYNTAYGQNKPMIFQYSRQDLKKIVSICNASDIVVLYDLTFFKTIIANQLNPSVTVIWRFFGYELYSRMENQVYSAQTLSVLKTTKPHKLYKWIGSIKLLLKYRKLYNEEKEFEKAIKRINYFFCLSSHEYGYLKPYWPYLPRFLQVPPFYSEPGETAISKKQNFIIIGNNRSAYNNHLDVLDMLEAAENKHNIQYKLLFNYGQADAYASVVSDIAARVNNFEVIKEFMSSDQFNQMYFDAAALVINGYRQMAIANIFHAFKCKVKVYLNKKNAIYGWLKEEGFKIYLTDQLIADIAANDIKLTEEIATYNLAQYKALCDKYSIAKFHAELMHITSFK